MKNAPKTAKLRNTLAALATVTLLLSACNTISGAGRDLESVGETVDDAAS